MKGIIIILFAVLLFQVEGTRRVRMFPGNPNNNNIISPMNICQDSAADQDMTNAGVIPAIMDYCTSQFGKTPDSVNVNDDNYPYKMCLVPQNATFGNLQPNTGMQIIAKDIFNNTSNQQVDHTFDLTGAFSQSIVIATTTTIDLSVSVSFEIGIPDIFTSTFTMDTSYSTSTTTSNSATNDLSFSPSTSYSCDPHCFYSVALEIEEFTYSSEISVDICLSGYARCSFGSRVNGHYYWYVLIDDVIPNLSDRCFTQQGKLSAITANVNSTTTFQKQCY